MLKKADSAGNKLATYNIALIYDDGIDIPKNYTEAKNWYEIGLGVQSNNVKAKEYYKQACLHKNLKGCKNYKRLNNQ